MANQILHEVDVRLALDAPKLIQYGNLPGLQFTLQVYERNVLLFHIPGFIIAGGFLNPPKAFRRGKWYKTISLGPEFQAGLERLVRPWRAEYPTVAFPQQSNDQVTSS